MVSGQNCKVYSRNTGDTYFTQLKHSSKLLYFETALNLLSS